MTGQEQKGLNEHPCTGYVPILSEGNLYPCVAGTTRQDRQCCRETEELAVHLNNFFLMKSGTVQQTQGSQLSYCRVPSPQGTGRRTVSPYNLVQLSTVFLLCFSSRNWVLIREGGKKTPPPIRPKFAFHRKNLSHLCTTKRLISKPAITRLAAHEKKKYPNNSFSCDLLISNSNFSTGIV